MLFENKVMHIIEKRFAELNEEEEVEVIDYEEHFQVVEVSEIVNGDVFLNVKSRNRHGIEFVDKASLLSLRKALGGYNEKFEEHVSQHVEDYFKGESEAVYIDGKDDIIHVYDCNGLIHVTQLVRYELPHVQINVFKQDNLEEAYECVRDVLGREEAHLKGGEV